MIWQSNLELDLQIAGRSKRQEPKRAQVNTKGVNRDTQGGRGQATPQAQTQQHPDSSVISQPLYVQVLDTLGTTQDSS